MKQLINKAALLIALLLSGLAFSQHETNLDGSKHTSPAGLEAVLSGLFIHTPEESVTDFATELHLTYWATHKWAFGVGYTIVFEDENRIGHELAALISHKPYKFLTVNVGPSFAMPNSHQDLEVSAYAETEWALQVGDFHTGPTLGVLVGHEFRYFGGLHISYEF